MIFLIFLIETVVGWTLSAYLKAAEVEEVGGAQFATTIAVAKDFVFVAAPTFSSCHTGVHFAPLSADVRAQNSSCALTGAVFVLHRHQSLSLFALILPPAIDQMTRFGWILSASSDSNELLVSLVDDTCDEGVTTTTTWATDDDSCPSSGAVLLYNVSSTTPSINAVARFKPHRNDYGQQWAIAFGISSAIKGDVVAIGAAGDSSSALGFNNFTYDAYGGPSFHGTGSVEVFVRNYNTSEYELKSYLKAFNAQTGAAFGSALALTTTTLTVCAPYDSSCAGSPFTSTCTWSGACYVYVAAVINSGVFDTLDAILKPPGVENDTNDARIGMPYTLSMPNDNLVLVGAKHKSQANGEAYLFQRQLPFGFFSKLVTFNASSRANSNAFFGSRVAILGDLVAINAEGDAHCDASVGAAFGCTLQGAVYLFNASNGNELAYLKPQNSAGDSNIHFGTFIGFLSSTVLLVGAHGDKSCNQSMPLDKACVASGALYLFDSSSSGDGNDTTKTIMTTAAATLLSTSTTSLSSFFESTPTANTNSSIILIIVIVSSIIIVSLLIVLIGVAFLRRRRRRGVATAGDLRHSQQQQHHSSRRSSYRQRTAAIGLNRDSHYANASSQRSRENSRIHSPLAMKSPPQPPSAAASRYWDGGSGGSGSSSGGSGGGYCALPIERSDSYMSMLTIASNPTYVSAPRHQSQWQGDDGYTNRPVNQYTAISMDDIDNRYIHNYQSAHLIN